MIPQIITEINSSLGRDVFNKSNVIQRNDRLLILTKWNWDYLEALKTQKLCLNRVKKNKDLMIFIFCNHPHCFTHGRGLQKGKDQSLNNLVEFNPSLMNGLSFPVHQIKRGGGLTFHYPGQWIIYPIINLNNPKFNLKSLTYWILDNVKSVLENHFGLTNLSTENVLLGLWAKDQKIASIGIGIEKFVTHHGLALNIYNDEKIFTELIKINPCGLNSQIYKCVEDLILPNYNFNTKQANLLEKFHDHFISELNFRN